MTHPVQRLSSVPAAAFRLAVALLAVATAARAVSPESRTETLARLGELPFHFEANHGQAGERFAFFARGRNCHFHVAPTEALLTLTRLDLPVPTTRGDRATQTAGRAAVTRQLHFEFVGASATARVHGDGALPARANYFRGGDAAQWRREVPLFGQVRVGQLYPGVDLVYYGNERRLEYDFIVAPRTDPGIIAIRFTGADQLAINARGELVFTLGADEIVQPRPFVYQMVAGARKEIASAYRLTDERTVTFQLGEYDRDRTLVIDPILSYARYFGGTGSDIGWDLALSKTNANVVYVAGETLSAGLPVTIGTNYGGGTSVGGDAFVAKFNLNSGSANPEYFTYLGGSGDDGALAIAVDEDGNTYVTGYTTSTNFPNVNGLFTNISGAAYPALGVFPPDAFVTKLGPDGAVLYSTYLGGSTNDVGIGIAVNAARNVFVTGYTHSTNFPTHQPLVATNAGGDDAFVTVLAPDGGSLIYSTYLGGTNTDHGEGIAADDAGNAYVTGYTSSTNFPVRNALQPFLNNPAPDATNHVTGFRDAFVARLDPAGANLLFATFFGGEDHDEGYRVTLDAQSNVYVCGAAGSLDFPMAVTNFQRGVTNTVLADAFVAKFTPDGGTNVYSVQFGGDNVDQAWDVAVDADGNAHVVGVTFSTSFPTADTAELMRATNAGGADVFVSVLNAAGDGFLRSALIGGSGGDFGYGIEVNAAGEDYLVGRTHSTDFPNLAPFNTARAGTNDVFIAKIGNDLPALSITTTNDGGLVFTWQGHGFDVEANDSLVASNSWERNISSPVFQDGTYREVLYPLKNAVFFRLWR